MDNQLGLQIMMAMNSCSSHGISLLNLIETLDTKLELSLFKVACPFTNHLLMSPKNRNRDSWIACTAGKYFDTLSAETISAIFSFLHENELKCPLEICKMFNGTLRSSVYVRVIGGPFEESLNRAMLDTYNASKNAKGCPDFLSFCRTNILMLKRLFESIFEKKDDIFLQAPSDLQQRSGRMAETWKVALSCLQDDRLLLKIKILEIALKIKAQMREMTDDLHALAKCCEDMKKGSKTEKLLREIFNTLLCLGNAMHNSKDEQASGFYLSSLKSIEAVKSTLHEDYNLLHHSCVVWLRKHVEESGRTTKQARMDLQNLLVALERIQNAFKQSSLQNCFSRRFKIDFENVHQELGSVRDRSQLIEISSFFISLMQPSIDELLALQRATKDACRQFFRYSRFGYTKSGYIESQVAEDVGAFVNLLKFAASDNCEKASICIEVATRRLREKSLSCSKSEEDREKHSAKDRDRLPIVKEAEIPSKENFNDRLKYIRTFHEKAQEPVTSKPLNLNEDEKPSREAFQRSQQALSSSLSCQWAELSRQNSRDKGDSVNNSSKKQNSLDEKTSKSVTDVEEKIFKVKSPKNFVSDLTSEGGESSSKKEACKPRGNSSQQGQVETVQTTGSSNPKNSKGRVLGIFGGKILTAGESSGGVTIRKWHWNPIREAEFNSIWNSVHELCGEHDETYELGSNNFEILEVMFSTGSHHLNSSIEFREAQKYFTMHDYQNVETKAKSKLGIILDAFLKQVSKEESATTGTFNNGVKSPKIGVKTDDGEVAAAMARCGVNFFSYSELVAMREMENENKSVFADRDICRSALEDHLSNFEEVFKMSRGEFKQLPKWKRISLKKEKQLF